MTLTIAGSRLDFISKATVVDHFWLACATAAVTALELGVPEAIVVRRVESFGGVHVHFSTFEKAERIPCPSGRQKPLCFGVE